MLVARRRLGRVDGNVAPDPLGCGCAAAPGDGHAYSGLSCASGDACVLM